MQIFNINFDYNFNISSIAIHPLLHSIILNSLEIPATF